MSNKGGRVSPDYLADIAPEYALRVQNAVFTSILQLRNSCFRNSGFATINAPHMMGFCYHSGAYCKDNLM